ncbi:unnamed protein product [Rotaria socialis]
MTTHKSQGQTLGKIIIDLVMPPGPVEVASVYVPLSRVKRLDDLLIIRPFEFAALQVKPSTAQREELKRLDRIAKTTPKRFPISMRHSLCSSQTSHQPHEKHLTFHINSSDYEAAFVNNETSTNTINKLLNHMKIFKQYSIDTESERANNQLSLIQINSITITPPSLVMLFELEQLPDRNSQKYENILQLFQIIFRTNNKIYSWEKMQIELEPVKEFLVLPIPAMLIDIQPHFSMWYSWARTQCGVQSLSHRNDKINDNEIIQQHNQHPSCDCHPSSPYKINKVWSLQNSLKQIMSMKPLVIKFNIESFIFITC